MALWGAKVMCETNCFSVGNMLKSVPYSLSTNWTVSTPIASIPAKSTPLIRYSAWRRGSSPRFLIACAFFGLLNFGAACPRHSSRSISASFPIISRSYSAMRSWMASYIFRACPSVNKWSATPEMERMAAWLKERNVESVAMEATGVYWVAPHEVLERTGLEVVLVETRQLARGPGRKKSDRMDCKWLQRLHSCGLLLGAIGNLAAGAADRLDATASYVEDRDLRD